jgi:hypothetical protein
MYVKYPKNFINLRNQKILEYCKWKKVLHIWACDSPLTKDKYNWKIWPLLYLEIAKILERGGQLWIDLDKESIDFLNSKEEEFSNSRVIFFDMNKLEDLDFKPDVIIFWEVIEHLMNLEIALTNLKKVMWKDTLLIISTPNAICLDNFLKWFFWFETLHDDHKVFFTYWYLQNLLKFNWIKVEKWYFTTLDYDKNELNWKGKLSIFLETFLFKYFRNTLLFICKKEN